MVGIRAICNKGGSVAYSAPGQGDDPSIWYNGKAAIMANGSWNFPDLVKFTSTPDMYTLQQGLAIILNKGADLVPDLATLMAGVVLTSIMPVIIFAIGQKYFIRSIASTGLKG